MGFTFTIGEAKMERDDYSGQIRPTVVECEVSGDEAPHTDEYEATESGDGSPTRMISYSTWHDVRCEISALDTVFADMETYVSQHSAEFVPVTWYADRLDDIEQEARELSGEIDWASERALWFTEWSREALSQYGDVAAFDAPDEFMGAGYKFSIGTPDVDVGTSDGSDVLEPAIDPAEGLAPDAEYVSMMHFTESPTLTIVPKSYHSRYEDVLPELESLFKFLENYTATKKSVYMIPVTDYEHKLDALEQVLEDTMTGQLDSKLLADVAWFVAYSRSAQEKFGDEAVLKVPAQWNDLVYKHVRDEDMHSQMYQSGDEEVRQKMDDGMDILNPEGSQ